MRSEEEGDYHQQSVPPAFEAPSAKDEPTSKQKRLMATLAAVGGLLLVLAFAVVLLWSDSSSSSSNKNNNQDPTFATCNFHGLKYLDSPDTCSCFTNFRGDECQELDTSAQLDLATADPELLRQWWIDRAVNLTLPVPPDFRQSGPRMLPGLLELIITLHNQTGNAETKERTIVLGYGATQLLNAAIWAFSQPKRLGGTSEVKAFANAPFHYQLKDIFAKEGISITNKAEDADFEIITYPNNADNTLPRLDSEAPNVIHDMVYAWPSFYGNASRPLVVAEVMLFSLSYLSGHPSLRFGWALVKDPGVAARMKEYIEITTGWVGTYQMLFAKQLLSSIVQSGNMFFEGVRDKLLNRWNQVQSLLDATKSSPFSLVGVPGAFLWLKCKSTSCTATLGSLKVMGRDGSFFYTDPSKGSRYVRLSLLCQDQRFERLLTLLNSTTTIR